MTTGTISEILKTGADDATALSAPGGVPLSYRDLRALVADVAQSLAGQGIGPGDRVGIVLDNGPEMAAAFLSIGSAATAAPLNPTYRAEEFEFYLTDLRAKLLVATKGTGFSSGHELISFGTILSEQNADTNEVIRHRNFTKALLIILILGGLIRFFTSPTYVKFISDALDPKAF